MPRRAHEIGECRKGARNDHVEDRVAIVLDTTMDDLDVLKSQFGFDLLQERRLFLHAIEQRDAMLRSGDRERHTGQTSAGSDVQNTRWRAVREAQHRRNDRQ